MKNIRILSVLAAPILMFALTLPSRADTSDANVPTTCTDGTTSTATGRGACSGHGGVQKTSKAAPPPGATAECKDGTYSKSKTHSGSCSHHGGVAQFLTPAQ